LSCAEPKGIVYLLHLSQAATVQRSKDQRARDKYLLAKVEAVRGKVEEDLAAAEMTSKGLVRQLQSAKAANREQFEQSTKMQHLLDCSMKELAGTKGANANLVAELRVAKQDIARKARELEGAKTQGENDLALESRKRAKESMVKEKLAKANEKMETDNKQLRLEVSELLQWKKKSNIEIWNKHKWEKQRDNVMAELKLLQ